MSNNDSTSAEPTEHGEQCDLCGEEGSTTPVDVQEEGSSARMTVDLCKEYEERANQYGLGEDIDWTEVA